MNLGGRRESTIRLHSIQSRKMPKKERWDKGNPPGRRKNMCRNPMTGRNVAGRTVPCGVSSE